MKKSRTTSVNNHLIKYGNDEFLNKNKDNWSLGCFGPRTSFLSIFSDRSEYKYTPRVYTRNCRRKRSDGPNWFSTFGRPREGFVSHVGPRGIQKDPRNPKPWHRCSIRSSQKEVRQGGQKRIQNWSRNGAQEGSEMMAFGRPKTINSVKLSSNSCFFKVRRKEKKWHENRTEIEPKRGPKR